LVCESAYYKLSYQIRCEILGEKHHDTIRVGRQAAMLYDIGIM